MESFPLRLHSLLEDAERLGYSHIIHWNEDGRSFQIDDPMGMPQILHHHTKITKFKSFLRQLQHYGKSHSC
jgi:hypothetical protein